MAGCCGAAGVCWWVRVIDLDSFTVSLHSTNGRHLPAIRAVQGDCQWPLIMLEIPTCYMIPECVVTSITYIYIEQPITKGWCQWIGGHVSYPTGSPRTTRLGTVKQSIIDRAAQSTGKPGKPRGDMTSQPAAPNTLMSWTAKTFQCLRHNFGQIFTLFMAVKLLR